MHFPPFRSIFPHSMWFNYILLKKNNQEIFKKTLTFLKNFRKKVLYFPEKCCFFENLLLYLHLFTILLITVNDFEEFFAKFKENKKKLSKKRASPLHLNQPLKNIKKRHKRPYFSSLKSKKGPFFRPFFADFYNSVTYKKRRPPYISDLLFLHNIYQKLTLRKQPYMPSHVTSFSSYYNIS